MEFTTYIKTLMELRDLKQADLCRLTNIPSSLMSAYVQGKKSPALTNAFAIADALNVSLDELVGRSPSIKNDFNLSSDELTHIKKYRALDERGKSAVDAILDSQYEAVKPKDAGTSERMG